MTSVTAWVSLEARRSLNKKRLGLPYRNLQNKESCATIGVTLGENAMNYETSSYHVYLERVDEFRLTESYLFNSTGVRS